jgi:hypothetical protein
VRRTTHLIALGLSAILAMPMAAPGEGVDYATQIKPILSARCYSCHSALRQKSGLRLDTAAMLIKGGDSGSAIEPGKSADSLVVQYITGEGGIRMPPEDDGAPLKDDQIALLKKWIDEGARAPDEPTPPDPRDHWAYRPPVRPEPPVAKNPAWVRNPIDAFLAADHESHGLSPIAPAEKSVLLRRVYLDLVGLPPTRDELAAFLADESPDAYEKVVDRLLASPQYGERWARHWMDVWRYSDWAGYRQEVRDSARHIWHWRDWIVESLNADKGYDRMLQEMLAGDEIAPTDSNTLRATGFLVRNWHKFNRNTWLEGTVEHTAKAFLGVTMNCCRCHDHKFDPIGQAEYFQFRAIFEPHDVRTDRVPGEPDPLKNGLPHVCDSKPEAPTYLFERGSELRPDKSEAMSPGVPKAFGSELTIAPVDLPVSAYYPALQEFAIQEDEAKASQQIATSEAALAKAQADVAAARKREGEAPAEPPKTENDSAGAPPSQELVAAVAAAELASKQLETSRAAQTSLFARIAAEKAKCGQTLGADLHKLAVDASKAQRQLALVQAQELQVVAQQELARATAALKPEDAATRDAVAAAQTKITAGAAALAAAHAALAAPSAEYAPLGEQLPRTSTGRRLALARWITDRKNPLAARVAINHIWLRHFGAPRVDNTFDFGLRSPQSRNQPLLDWLAVELMEHGWQMKHIHRLLVTSNAYRMKSTAVDTSLANVEIDRDNRYLWRMNPRRMEAEAVRDSLFYLAGNLDLTRGGPDLAFELAPTTPRRSIYFTHAYEKQAKFLELFDGASVNECYRRSESIVPQQALALANSDTSRDQSRVVARKLSELVAKDPEPDHAFVQLAFKQLLGRDPSPAESGECRSFLLSQAEILQKPDKLTPFTGGAKATVEASSDAIQRAREDLTLVLFNHNDFITIR